MGIITDNMGLAQELVRYARLCYDRRLVGAAGGNLSARLPVKDLFLVTARGIALRDVEPGNLLVVDIDGNIQENPAGMKPSKEAGFHFGIYGARPDINAVIHVHPTYATVYAVAGKQVPLTTISARIKLKQGAVVPEAQPGSQELRLKVAQVLETSPEDVSVLVLERHGLVAFRPNVRDAFDDLELAEDTAKIALLLGRSGLLTHHNGTGKQVVDLTAPLNERLPVYPSDPSFRKSWHLDYRDAGVYVSRLELGSHTGTHVDAPLHDLEDGSDVATMSLSLFFGEAVAIDAPKQPGENITAADFANADIREGDIVLFRTGWEERSGSPRFFDDGWPGFAPQAVDALLTRRVKAIGGDIASADSPRAISEGRLAHKKALGAGLPIFEALVNMKEVVGRRFLFVGLPLKIEAGDASPIRAVAILDRSTE